MTARERTRPESGEEVRKTGNVRRGLQGKRLGNRKMNGYGTDW